MDNKTEKNMQASVAKKTLGMHPKKFALWLFMISIVMIFASMTSAYIVRMAEGNWLYFELPTSFYVSTAVILASSATMHMALMATRKDNLGAIKSWLIATSVLGIGFLFLQLDGWGQMIDVDVYFVGNPSGSFVYVITGLHAAHIISAILYVAVILVESLRHKIHSKSVVRMEMCAQYWHFLDALWLYLFVFMLIYR